MGQRTDEVNDMPADQVAPGLSKMLTLEQVQEVLNVKSSLVYALVRSGQLPAAQFGGRGIWRVRESDLAAYIEDAFAKTAERIASGQIPQDHVTDND
jgi:excisionase family DNA binding protein